MTIKDFKIGQTVYALSMIKGKTTSHMIKKYTVLSVGRKYVKAALEGAECPDSFYLDKDTDDYLTEDITWREPAKLFLTEAAANDDVEKDMLRSWLKNATEWRRISDYTLEQLRAVREILEGAMHTTMEEKIMEKSKFDITKQKLWAAYENFYLDRDRNAFVAIYDYVFDPREYFGVTPTNPQDEGCLTFLTEWYMDTDDLAMHYFGDFKENDGNELEKPLTPYEKEFFKKLMDQFCMEKYGVDIFHLHRPLTEAECDICSLSLVEKADDSMFGLFLPLSETKEAMAAIFHLGDKKAENDEEDDGAEEDWNEDDGEEEDVEFDVKIEMLIQLPDADAQDKETITANITKAFDVTNARDWIDDAEFLLDDGTVQMNFTAGVTDDDCISAENACLSSLRDVEKELNKLGYQVTDISCDAEEV